MEQALTGSVDKLLERGLSGIVMLGLAFVCWRLFKLLTENQEKRITEARESLEAVRTNTATLEKLADLIRTRREA